MKIINPHSTTGWITAIICDRYVCAKVYDLPSTFGVNDGRVSKLSICKTAHRDPDANYLDQMAYNYDRGLDFDNLPSGLLDKILAELEALPKRHGSGHKVTRNFPRHRV
jgi:hypothetical protein